MADAVQEDHDDGDVDGGADDAAVDNDAAAYGCDGDGGGGLLAERPDLGTSRREAAHWWAYVVQAVDNSRS